MTNTITTLSDKYTHLTPGTVVRVARDVRYGHVDGHDWILDGIVPAGSLLVLQHETNAGFRGLEWSAIVRSDPSVRVHGVSVTDMAVVR